MKMGRQTRAQTRPENTDHDVGYRRRRDLILKVAGGAQWLVFPENRLQFHERRKLVVQAPHDTLSDEALLPHIAGRGNENLQFPDDVFACALILRCDFANFGC